MRIEELLIESHNLEEGPIWDKTKAVAGQVGNAAAQGVGAAAQGVGAVVGGARGAWDRAKQGYKKGFNAVVGTPRNGSTGAGGAPGADGAPGQTGGTGAVGGGGAPAGGGQDPNQLRQQGKALIKQADDLEKQQQQQKQQQTAPAQNNAPQTTTPANSTTNSLDTPQQTAPASAEAQPASPEEQPAPASNGLRGNKGFGFHPHTGQPFASAKERADFDASPEAKMNTDEWEASQGKGAPPPADPNATPTPGVTPPADPNATPTPGVTPPADAKTTTPPADTAPANTKDPKAYAAATLARLKGQRAAGKSMATSTSGNFSNYVQGGGGQTLQGADKNGNPIFKQNVKREDIQFESKFLGMMI